jgi:predicted signal transduction protein with EAL and GGDEF domain
VLEGGSFFEKTASIGFAAFPFVPSEPEIVGWSQVVELADQALYSAKRAGRNTWCGLAATANTDAKTLVRLLATSAEDAVRGAGMLTLIKRP